MTWRGINEFLKRKVAAAAAAHSVGSSCEEMRVNVEFSHIGTWHE